MRFLDSEVYSLSHQGGEFSNFSPEAYFLLNMVPICCTDKDNNISLAEILELILFALFSIFSVNISYLESCIFHLNMVDCSNPSSFLKITMIIGK